MTRYIHIHISSQTLSVIDNHATVFKRWVSTAQNGVGEVNGSGCTPRGWLVVKAKIGAGCPINAVFIGRRFSGEIFSPTLQRQYPQRDWILSRILWLGGLEAHVNRYAEVDTLRRYIYIHGCPDSEPMGIPLSHGCIRMRHQDVVALFDLVTVGCRVWVQA